MKHQSSASLGYLPGIELPAIGRAKRHELKGREQCELWVLSADDRSILERLLSLGEKGVGGFIDGGIDGAAEHWLIRRVPAQTLAEKLREKRGPWPWPEALRTGLAIARILSACEQASFFPGPLAPDGIGLDEEQKIYLLANSMVFSLVGGSDAKGGRDGHAVAPLWTPPEQADGGSWDNAANRYVLGHILYKLISGEHPFGGAGLRHALDEAAHREAPPFVQSIAADLPSGLQSLILRILSPEKDKRPSKSERIAQELERFLREENSQPQKTSLAAVPDRAPKREKEREREREREREKEKPSEKRDTPVSVQAAPPREKKPNQKKRTPAEWAKGLWPLGLGLVVAGISISLLKPAPPPARTVNVGTVSVLSQSETAGKDCASCHPRQAAEWRRSVMAHSVKSPLFNGLESLIEEQVGRDFDCPGGAGILRRADSQTACRVRNTGIAITGSGGEHWCVNCHSPADNLGSVMPAWDGRPGGDSRTRRPVRDLLGDKAMEGISCGFCHQVHGPVGPRGSRGYQGNPTWTSFLTGTVFQMRPEDGKGLFGIGNSGYDLRPEELLLPRSLNGRNSGRDQFDQNDSKTQGMDPVVHARPSQRAVSYLRSSEFCGSCHDVRLFGTDSLGVSKGEHFKRLRNAYSEWVDWAKQEERAGRTAYTCQDCHMSTFPGVCEPDPNAPNPADAKANPEENKPEKSDRIDGDRRDRRSALDEPPSAICPPGMRFVPKAPGAYSKARVADNSPSSTEVVTHYFSGVDVPLSYEFPEALTKEITTDLAGIPLGAEQRRDMLLRATFRFQVGASRFGGGRLEIPIEIENIGGGHRVPAGFSQEREFWVHLVVRDADGRLVYEVGRVDRPDEDLHDKVFLRVNTRPDIVDRLGRPEGLFGADVRDGPDVPQWSPPPVLGGTNFRGKGLINFQNGFLRCVRCIGVIGRNGECEALPGQGQTRADRFDDGDYDLDTGECRSNLTGFNAFFETYFPVGALDASRGFVRGPDAIIDTRSVPPGVPIRYTYELPAGGKRAPFTVQARLLFRAFPPFLVKAFADYEREQANRGLRPSGPAVTHDMLRRLPIVEIARDEIEVR